MKKLSATSGVTVPNNIPVCWYKNTTVLIAGGLLLFYLLIYILPLGYRPLLIPDETRYAEIPREMLATGDWVTPHLNGLRYFEKPPLGYWLNATSIALLGENEFAIRFPSTFAAGLTTFIVYLFALQVWANRRIALAAALIHMTCLEVYVVGTLSVLDNFLTLFLTSGIFTFYLAVNGEQKNTGCWKLWIAPGISFGLAFLVKGFLAFAIPLLVLVPWMMWQGEWRTLIKKGWWVIFAAILIALPWSVLIHLREGDFWNYFFWIEHIKRFTADNAQHKAPFYYYLMYLPALAFPWLSLLPAAISGLRGTDSSGLKKQNALRLLWLWLLLPFLFFSTSSGKLVTYILPCFPPFAVLTAVGLIGYLNSRRDKLFKFGVLFNTLVFLCLLAALLIIQAMDVGFRFYDETEHAKLAVLALSLLIGTSAGLAAFRAKRYEVKLAASVVIIAPLLLSISFAIPIETMKHKAPGQLFMQYLERVDNNTIIISEASLLRATAWYLKRDDIYLISKGEVEYGLGFPEARHRYLDKEHFQSLLENNTPGRSILMACKGQCDEQLTALLPPIAKKQVWGRFAIWYVPDAGN